MNFSEDIRSLTDFKKNTGEFTEHLKATGRPVVLTVNGRASLVVQDAAAYQEMMEALERAAIYEDIRTGLEETERGEGQPAAEVFAEMREMYRNAAKTKGNR